MTSITQDMKYRQSLCKYAEKHGVSRASRKYNRSRSYIYFWLNRYDGTIESLACQSRRPKSHPNQHTPEEIKLIRDMRKRNPKLGLVLFWLRLRTRGYTRSITGLFRLMQRLKLFKKPPAKKRHASKPYQQMEHPGQRVQIDVKVVPMACRKGNRPHEKYYQYTAIDEFSRMRVVKAYKEQSAYSSSQFLHHVAAFFRRRGVVVECVQTDNGFEFTNRFSNSSKNRSSLFELIAADLGIIHKLIRPYTPRHNGSKRVLCAFPRSNVVTAKIKSASTMFGRSIALTILTHN